MEIILIITPKESNDSLEYGYPFAHLSVDPTYSTPGETIQKNILSFFVTPDNIRVVGKVYLRATFTDSNNDGIMTYAEYQPQRYNYKGQTKIYTGDSYTPPLTLR